MLSNCRAGEDSWESLGLSSKEIKPINPKGNQPWIFIGRTDAEAETPILWPPDGKSWLTGKDWGQEEKGATEDELVGWHHQLNGHEFVQDPGDSDRQGGLTSCSPWSRKESGKTERLNSNKVKFCHLQHEQTLRVLWLMKCQTEKHKHCMLSLVCEILNIQHTNEYTNRDTDPQIRRTKRWLAVGREGKRGKMRLWD